MNTTNNEPQGDDKYKAPPLAKDGSGAIVRWAIIGAILVAIVIFVLPALNG